MPMNEIVDRFGRGQRVAVDQALSFGNEAINVGARVGNGALERIATQAKNRPMATLAVTNRPARTSRICLPGKLNYRYYYRRSRGGWL